MLSEDHAIGNGRNIDLFVDANKVEMRSSASLLSTLTLFFTFYGAFLWMILISFASCRLHILQSDV